jgi:iron transport multicopper oxidase
MATFVEAPLDMQQTLAVPQEHFAVCEKAGVPTAGNAAANMGEGWLDLSGERTPPARLPEG